MDKFNFLLVVIVFGYLIAPYFTNYFFLNNSKSYSQIHLICILIVLVSIFLRFPLLSFVWILFCGFGLYRYLAQHNWLLFRGHAWLGIFPFLFSLVSSIWFVSGSNDYRLLGYDTTWSYYAAIHGCFIGWLLLSGMCFLAIKYNSKPVFKILICIVIGLFFLIGLGIYQFPFLKKIGVIGYFFLLPYLVFTFAKRMNPKLRMYQLLLGLSFVSLCFTLSLAVFKEFFQPIVMFTEFYTIMIYIHGGFNAFLVIPVFLYVIRKEENLRISHNFN